MQTWKIIHELSVPIISQEFGKCRRTSAKTHVVGVPATTACDFRCDSGQCINNSGWCYRFLCSKPSSRCNGKKQCADGSDENNCSELGLKSFKVIIVKFCCHPCAYAFTLIRNYNYICILLYPNIFSRYTKMMI